MTHCWYTLNLDIKGAIRKDWKFPNTDLHGIWRLPAWDVFELEWLKKCFALGLEFSALMLFHRKPFVGTNGAHIDLNTKDNTQIDTYAVNWILGGAGSQMIWYELPPGDLPVSYTSANTPYTYWPLNELTEIDRCSIRLQPTLVKIDKPHSIEMGPEERWCISARPRLKNRMEWDELLDHLRSLNLLVERVVDSGQK